MDAPLHAVKKEERFTSWKDIANYLKRDVRTVQRWEAARGLPVHRLPGRARSPIYALRSEIDEWWAGSPARQEPLEVVELPSRRFRAWPWALGALLAAGAAVAAWFYLNPNQPAAPLPVVPLTSLPGVEHAPSLSPGGKRLVFTWVPPSSRNPDLYVVDLPDGSPKRITEDPAPDIFAEWSPDGQRLAYVRMFSGRGAYELRLFDFRDSSDRLLLLTEIPGVIVSPAWLLVWTPDGAGLVLGRPRAPGGTHGMTFYDLKTGNEHRLTPPVAGVSGEVTPALSPDGRRLVFQRRTPSGEGDLFLVDLNPDHTAAGPPRQLSDCKKISIAL